MVVDQYFSKSRMLGHLYFGENTSQQRNGFGMQIFWDFTVFVGNWQADMATGNGIMIFENGTIIEGTFKNNFLVEGTVKYPNQALFFGQFEENKEQSISSRGVFFFKNKCQLNGIWDNGILTKGVLCLPKNDLSQKLDKTQNSEIKIDFSTKKSNFKKNYSHKNDCFYFFGENGIVINNLEKSIEEGFIDENTKKGTYFEYKSQIFYSEYFVDYSLKKTIMNEINIEKGYSKTTTKDKENGSFLTKITFFNGIKIIKDDFRNEIQITMPIFGNDYFQEKVVSKLNLNNTNNWDETLKIGKGSYFFENNDGKQEYIECEHFFDNFINPEILKKRICFPKIVPKVCEKHKNLEKMIETFVIKEFPNNISIFQNFFKIGLKSTISEKNSKQAKTAVVLNETEVKNSFLNGNTKKDSKNALSDSFQANNNHEFLDDIVFKKKINTSCIYIQELKEKNKEFIFDLDEKSVIESDINNLEKDDFKNNIYPDNYSFQQSDITFKHKKNLTIDHFAIFSVFQSFSNILQKNIVEKGVDPIDYAENLLNSIDSHFIKESKIIGSFENNKKDGFCIVFYENGSVFKGFFSNGIKNGKGIFYNFNGEAFLGDYLMNQPIGIFLKITAENKHFICEYINGSFEVIEKKNIDGFDVTGDVNFAGKMTGEGVILCGHFELKSQFILDVIDMRSPSIMVDRVNDCMYKGHLKLNSQKNGVFITENQKLFRVSLGDRSVEDLDVFLNE